MDDHEQQPQRPEGGERPAETPGPRIWAGALADYNNGLLRGEWLDAAVEDDELREAVQAILARSPTPGAEEFAILDYEGFGKLRLGESERLELVAEVARGIVQHGLAFAAWAELHDCDPSMLHNFQDSYLGAYESRQAWAQSIVDDYDVERSISASLPDWLARHVRIDLAGIAYDLQVSGDVWVEDNPDGGVWVFDARG